MSFTYYIFYKHVVICRVILHYAWLNFHQDVYERYKGECEEKLDIFERTISQDFETASTHHTKVLEQGYTGNHVHSTCNIVFACYMYVFIVEACFICHWRWVRSNSGKHTKRENTCSIVVQYCNWLLPSEPILQGLHWPQPSMMNFFLNYKIKHKNPLIKYL